MDKPIALIFLSIAENTKSFAEEIKYTIHSKKVMYDVMCRSCELLFWRLLPNQAKLYYLLNSGSHKK